MMIICNLCPLIYHDVPNAIMRCGLDGHTLEYWHGADASLEQDCKIEIIKLKDKKIFVPTPVYADDDRTSSGRT